MSSLPFNHTFNHSMHQSAYNTSYRKRRSPQSVDDEGVYSSDEDYDSDYDRRSDRSVTPERERRRSYAADGARDIPRRHHYTANDHYAPRGVYDPRSDRAPYKDSHSKYHPNHSSSYQNDGNLVPYPSRHSLDGGHYNDRRRERADSVASHGSLQSLRSHRSGTSHRSSTSGRSHRDKYDRDGRRRSSKHHEPKPSVGDSVMLLLSSVKGAFDRRR